MYPSKKEDNFLHPILDIGRRLRSNLFVRIYGSNVSEELEKLNLLLPILDS